MNTIDRLDSHSTHDADEDVRNRDIKIYVNGEIVHRDEAKVSVYDSGFMLGDGMWEGMRLYNGKWAFFDEHMDRFFEFRKAVSLDVGLDRAGIRRCGLTRDPRGQRHDR
jgi:branched-chain amino acid aminotransferase